MPVLRVDWITREQVRAGYPDTLFVFGDNMQRRGLGGQAREMRGEINAVGIPTKWRPNNDDGAFFNDEDLLVATLVAHKAMDRLRAHLAAGGTVVIPADGVGTGRARLRTRAPRIAEMIDKLLSEL